MPTPVRVPRRTMSAIVVRRGTRTGVGIRQMWAYLGIGVGYVLLTTGILRGPFTAPIWIIGCIVCAGLAAIMLVFVYRLPDPGDTRESAGRPDLLSRST